MEVTPKQLLTGTGLTPFIIIAVALLVAALNSARHPQPFSAVTQTSSASTPAASTPTSSAEFRAYMGALAPLMPAVFAANEAPENCAQMADTAAETAPAALVCLRQSAAAVRQAAAMLHNVRAPTEFSRLHQELLAFADEDVHGADVYVTSFGQAVPALERLRRHEPLSSLWTRAQTQNHPPAILEQLDEQSSISGSAFAHRLTWLNQMHPLCNRTFRCVPRNVSLAALQDPRNRTAHGHFIQQANCDCIRVWATMRGETNWTLLTADETELPAWDGRR